MDGRYHIPVLFTGCLKKQKARPSRNRPERALMIRLELGTATGAQSGSIRFAGEIGKRVMAFACPEL
jgi:hypothetical protein